MVKFIIFSHDGLRPSQCLLEESVQWQCDAESCLSRFDRNLDFWKNVFSKGNPRPLRHSQPSIPCISRKTIVHEVDYSMKSHMLRDHQSTELDWHDLLRQARVIHEPRLWGRWVCDISHSKDALRSSLTYLLICKPFSIIFCWY